MISILEDKILLFENNKMGFEINLDNGLSLKQIKHSSIPSRKEVSVEEKEIFQIEIEDNVYPASQFKIEELQTGHDSTEEMVSISLREETAKLSAKVILLQNKNRHDLNLIIQLAADWDQEGPSEVFFHMPFLANYSLSSEEPNFYLFPKNPFSKDNGESIIQMHPYLQLPLGIFRQNQKQGFSLEFPTLSEPWFIWDQNRNLDLNEISSLKQLKNHRLLLRPDSSPSDIVDIRFTPINEGWKELFLTWKQSARKQLMLSEYESNEIKWYNDMFLQHFTYVFSKEVYNYDTNEVDVTSLLKEGEKMGGYDSVLLWHQYPRLGVDERSQWDFFNDFPGGRIGLKKLVTKFHEKGVKVFLPFKPWDINYYESPHQSTSYLVDLIKDTGIDGAFMDTMDSVPQSFRSEIKKVKPSFVFCTEGRPKKKETIETITGSWNQYKNKESMPEADLFRYVLPEHFSPIISRWHVGIRKDLLIKRAIFNGTGILVWQDIFGTWLPYNDKQKSQIKKWKKIWKDNQNSYQCSNPIPLYPTLRKGLYCNYFPSDCGERLIYSVYNDTKETIEGSLLQHNSSLHHITELWNDTSVHLKQSNNRDSILYGTVQAKEIAIYHVTR